MINLLQSRLLSVIVVVLGLVYIGATSTVFQAEVSAQNRKAVCDGVKFTGAKCGGNTEGEISTVVQRFLRIFSSIIGIVAVFVMLYGGFKYITAAGDAGKIASAQSTIIYAIVGLVVAALAQVLVRYVLDQTARGT